MKKILSVFAFSLYVLSSASAFAGNDGVQVRFHGACHMGNADINNGDIEFLNLNLDINAEQSFQSKKCEITTKFPGRHGHRLVVSTFKVEAFADLKHEGVASLSLRHNFRNRGWKADEAKARRGDRALVVEQTAVGRTECHEDAELKTEITTGARNAILLQDSATNIIAIKYYYEMCH